MRKITVGILLLLTVGLSPALASALTMSSTTIFTLYPDVAYGGGTWIRFSGGTISGTVSCSATDDADTANWYWLKGDHVQYYAVYTTALTALTKSRTVNVVGDGTCSGNYENIRYIQLY